MERDARPIWYLHEWFAVRSMIQRDLITRLDWLPAKAHKIWHGIQRARLDEAAEIADLLGIRVHELLMPPAEAMRVRRLEAVLIEAAQTDTDPPPPAGGGKSV